MEKLKFLIIPVMFIYFLVQNDNYSPQKKAFALTGRQACIHYYPGRCPGRALKKVPNFKLHSLFLNFNSCPRSISSFKSGILFWTGI